MPRCSIWCALLSQLHFAMVVAVAVVLVMQVAIDQIIDVVAVWHRWMAAAGSVYVLGVVALAGMPAGAAIGIGTGDRQRVFLDLACGGRVVQVTIMQIVDMPFMDDALVAALRAVFVIVIGVCVCHGKCL